jgi:hypothetical protein
MLYMIIISRPNYQWNDGNWGCDCNRWAEWTRANPKDDDGDDDTNHVCGEPRIRARRLEGREPFDDWPENDEQRVEMAERLKAERAELRKQWDAEI